MVGIFLHAGGHFQSPRPPISRSRTPCKAPISTCAPLFQSGSEGSLLQLAWSAARMNSVYSLIRVFSPNLDPPPRSDLTDAERSFISPYIGGSNIPETTTFLTQGTNVCSRTIHLVYAPFDQFPAFPPPERTRLRQSRLIPHASTVQLERNDYPKLPAATKRSRPTTTNSPVLAIAYSSFSLAFSLAPGLAHSVSDDVIVLISHIRCAEHHPVRIRTPDSFSFSVARWKVSTRDSYRQRMYVSHRLPVRNLVSHPASSRLSESRQIQPLRFSCSFYLNLYELVGHSSV